MSKDISPLGQWILNQTGHNAHYASVRQLALAAGLNQNTVNLIVERGRGEPETLIKLAEVCGTPPLKLFVLAGWLTEEEVADDSASQSVYAKTGDEEEVLRGYRRLPEEGKRWTLGGIRGMLGFVEGQAPVPPAGPEPGHHQANPESE